MGYYKRADEIQQEMLENMSDSYSKEKGYWLWEILKAVACGLSDFTQSLDSAANKLYVDNLQGDELEDYINNWSYIERKKMTQASGYVTLVAKTNEKGTVPQGTYVSNGSCNYIVAEDGEITDNGGACTLPVVAEEYGGIGNCNTGEINKLITSLNFIDGVKNYADITGGQDEESDDSFRSRYKEAIKKNANAGNVAYYEELAKSVDGVGNAYCIPCPGNVPGNVDIYVVNIDGKEVTSSVLNEVQNLIDPNKNGDGTGAAPVGAKVTVKNPTPNYIIVGFKVILEDNYTIESIENEVRDRISSYFDVAFNERIVRYNQIAKCILETEGVKDFENLLVDDSTENVLPADDVAIFILDELVIY